MSAADNSTESGVLNVIQFLVGSTTRLLLLPLLVVVLTIFLAPPSFLRSVVERDRALAYWEGMPLTLLPLWNQAARHPLAAPPATAAPTKAPVQVESPSAEPHIDDLMATGTKATIDQAPLSEDPIDGMLIYACSLIWPRMIVFAGFLLPLLGLIWAAWSYGRAAHSRLLNQGGVERPERYKRALNLFETLANITLAWIVIPYPLPALLMLIPGLGSLYFVYRLGENRA